MLELLGLLGGGIFRLIPTFLDFFKARDDRAHELALLDRQVQLEVQRGVNRQTEIVGMTQQAVDTAWAEGVVEAIKAQGQITGDKWLDRINVSVRPFLTYWWCIIWYSFSKLMLILAAWQTNTTFVEMSTIVLTDFDRGVVGSIIGFWFMDRALRISGK